MTIKNLKPLIGIKKDERIDWKNLTDDQRARIELAGSIWYAASGAVALAFSLATEWKEPPPLQEPAATETQYCRSYEPFGLGLLAKCDN